MTLVMTWVAGRVPANQDADLEEAYRKLTADELPPGAVESFLLRGESGEWRIATVWVSREALHEMRRATEVPGAIRVFRSVGVEPTVTIFDTAAHITRT